jgi:16S rRNA (guanine1516-N2)-methyltransferase
VLAEPPVLHEAALRLATRLGLPLAGTTRESGPGAGTSPDRPAADLILAVTSRRLELRAADVLRRHAVAVDWAGPLLDGLRRPGASRGLALARAVGALDPRTLVLDATAGLGRDAFRLAALGATVVAAERSPVLAALLEDGLRRADGDPDLSASLGGRLSVRAADARELLGGAWTPDVVLIDPMYPDAGRSALPRGEMQVLRRLLGPDEDADALFRAARSAARGRVVVKRHVRDPPLAGERPTRRVLGRSTRFDVYLAGPARAEA